MPRPRPTLAARSARSRRRAASGCCGIGATAAFPPRQRRPARRRPGCPAGRDVVLLNSDTLVPPGWLERLRACGARRARHRHRHPAVQRRDHPELSRPDRQSRARPPAGTGMPSPRWPPVHRGTAVEIPTAVGFCMYIRRECLRRGRAVPRGRFRAGLRRGERLLAARPPSGLAPRGGARRVRRAPRRRLVRRCPRAAAGAQPRRCWSGCIPATAPWWRSSQAADPLAAAAPRARCRPLARARPRQSRRRAAGDARQRRRGGAGAARPLRRAARRGQARRCVLRPVLAARTAEAGDGGAICPASACSAKARSDAFPNLRFAHARRAARPGAPAARPTARRRSRCITCSATTTR